jgi:hypothetical protein
MVEDEMLAELYRIKDSLGERFPTVHALAVEARRVAAAEPLPPAETQRKLIPGFPKGRSVANPDPAMEELYRTKESLAESPGREGDEKPRLKMRPKTSAKFRTAKRGATPKFRAH